MEREVVVEASPGELTKIIVSEPSEGCDRIVLLCHGFMSSKESQTNRLLTEKLLNENIATCRFDFYGHGVHKSPFQEITLSRCLKQIDAVLSWISEHSYARIGLLGSSYGGLTAILSAAKHAHITTVALKCPVSDYPPIWRALLGESGMTNWQADTLLSFATPEGRARLDYTFYEDLLGYDAYQEAVAIEAPVLIVHGDADHDVPFAQSRKLLQTLKCRTEFNAELVAIAGADHQFTKPQDFEQMIDHLFQWFVSTL